MLKGFKEFVLRGNIVELAVAFVIATAFATLVNTFVTAIIKPILTIITPGKPSFGFDLVPGRDSTFLDVGALITAVIVFVLTALLIYVLLVVPMNAYTDRRKARAVARGEEPETVPPTDNELLMEIRDLLRERNSA